MGEYMEIGCTPYDEECAQVGDADYPERSRLECQVFARQLKRLFPNGRFGVKSFPHDFGTYREVVAYMDTDEETDAAFAAEANTPEKWDNESRVELGLPISLDGSPLDELWLLMKRHNLTREQALILQEDMNSFVIKRVETIKGEQ